MGKPGNGMSLTGLFQLTEAVMVDPNDTYTRQLPLHRRRKVAHRLHGFLLHRRRSGGKVSPDLNVWAASVLQNLGGLAGAW